MMIRLAILLTSATINASTVPAACFAMRVADRNRRHSDALGCRTQSAQQGHGP